MNPYREPAPREADALWPTDTFTVILAIALAAAFAWDLTLLGGLP